MKFATPYEEQELNKLNYEFSRIKKQRARILARIRTRKYRANRRGQKRTWLSMLRQINAPEYESCDPLGLDRDVGKIQERL